MIQATTIHYLTLTTTDERTAHFVDAVHNMGAWLHEEFMTEDTFVRIHDILRVNIGTENFLSAVGYRDEREEKNEYHIKIVEFPEKSDGTIRKLKKGEEDDQYFLLTEAEIKEEEAKEIAHLILDVNGFNNTNTTDKKEQN